MAVVQGPSPHCGGGGTFVPLGMGGQGGGDGALIILCFSFLVHFVMMFFLYSSCARLPTRVVDIVMKDTTDAHVDFCPHKGPCYKQKASTWALCYPSQTGR